MKLNRSNAYPGTCCVCSVRVAPQRGFLLSASDVDLQTSKKWLTLCSARACVAKLFGEAEVADAEKRLIKADGTLAMVYDEDSLALRRAIAAKDDAGVWRASLMHRDRAHLFSVATKLQLTPDPSLLTFPEHPQVAAAVARARSRPTAREYQIAGVRWLAYRGLTDGARPDQLPDKQPGGLNADDPGCGKTYQALESVHDDEAVVVVCPANAKAVWPREAKKWRPDRFDRITLCEGEESFRWPESPRELVVINYDILPYSPAQIRNEREALLRKRHGCEPDPTAKKKAEREGVVGLLAETYTVADKVSALQRTGLRTTAQRHAYYLTLAAWVPLSDKLHKNFRALLRNAERKPCGKPKCKVLGIADEAHYVTNNKAHRTGSWRHLAKQFTRLYGLTATPVEDQPLKAWGLFTSLRCQPFSWAAFKEQFSAMDGAWGGLDFQRHAPSVGSTARGVVIVKPGTTEMLQRVMLRRRKDDVLPELPPKIYSEIPVELDPKLIAELDEISATYIDYLLRGELPPFTAMSGVLKALADASTPAALDEVTSYEDSDVPALVFSAHRGPIEKIGKRKGWAMITGDTSAAKRGEIEDDFQAGKLLGVAGTRAMCEALTLTRAKTTLFVDRFLARKHNEQAEDRAHRIGQTDSVNIVILVPEHPLARHIADLHASKEQFVNAVLHGDADYTPKRLTGPAPSETTAELLTLASRELTPEQSERRAKARMKLGRDLSWARGVSTASVQRELAAALRHGGTLDVATLTVARWLTPGVEAGKPCAVATAADLLLTRLC